MKKFIIIYHAPLAAMQQTMSPTPEQMAKGMELWKSWAMRCGNKLLDLGSPIKNGQVIDTRGQVKNSDSQMTGYSILCAEDFEEIKVLIDGHPHLSWHPECTIEVYELAPMPGMK
jgi:hypothetical protein